MRDSFLSLLHQKEEIMIPLVFLMELAGGYFYQSMVSCPGRYRGRSKLDHHPEYHVNACRMGTHPGQYAFLHIYGALMGRIFESRERPWQQDSA
jgi:hypothetical protein